MSFRKLKLKSARCLSLNRYLKWLLHTVDLLFSKIKTDFYNKANIFFFEYPTNQSSDILKFCFSYTSHSGPSVNLLYANFLSPSSDLTNIIWILLNFTSIWKSFAYIWVLERVVCKYIFANLHLPPTHTLSSILCVPVERWFEHRLFVYRCFCFRCLFPEIWKHWIIDADSGKKHLQVSINSMWRVSFYL